MSGKERTRKKKWAEGMHPGLEVMPTLLNERHPERVVLGIGLGRDKVVRRESGGLIGR